MSKAISRQNNQISIRGACTHNLKSVDLSFPKQQLVIVTGVSGSGKSSLAFDTIYADGQRRYIESLSAYARQFLERIKRPDIEQIEGMCPAIAIRQKSSPRNPRSTVGTTTEVHDYLRLLYARIGKTICRRCSGEVIRESPELVAKKLANFPKDTRLLVGFEVTVSEVFQGLDENTPETAVDSQKAVVATIETLRRKGFSRLFNSERVLTFDDVDPREMADRDRLQIIIDRVTVRPGVLGRLTESIEAAYIEGNGSAFAIEISDSSQHSTIPKSQIKIHPFSERFECHGCNILYELPRPILFSFNSPFGACQTCHGFGNIIELDMDLVVPDQTKSLQDNAIEPWSRPKERFRFTELKRVAKARNIRMNVPWEDLTRKEKKIVIDGDGQSYGGIRGFFKKLERKKYKVHVRVFLSRYRSYLTCPDCGGARLRREAREVIVGDLTIDQLCALTIRDATEFLGQLKLTDRETTISKRVLREILSRLSFLSDVGLDYLSLDRLSSSLSGGESQRINLATSLGSTLVGTLYVLDEPSVGLHSRDNRRLLKILRKLRDQGNTVLVVEHDADIIRSADYVVDLGLGAGEQGGRVVYAGSFEGLLKEPQSLTAKYLRGELTIPLPRVRRKHSSGKLRLFGATEHNLKDLDVEIPLNTLTCVTGVSGSGKSTLVHDVLYAAIKREKGDWKYRVGTYRQLEGVELINNAVLIDQAPIGRTPRSNPVTYLKAFDPIRKLFASTKDAISRGLTASHFSFNVPGGRCDSCDGAGEVRMEMQFMPDVFVPCDECNGTRFKRNILEVRYRGKCIDEVLNMTVREALSFFNNSPQAMRRLRILEEIGLGYLRLGQPATTLSGGEAQRIKIAAHLSSHSGERNLYVLDEPTTGLHFDDIATLLTVFRKLLQAGHSLLVIEHNLDVIKTADWVIDLGPEGGGAGGHAVVTGVPEDVALSKNSHTGKYLRRVLATSRSHI